MNFPDPQTVDFKNAIRAAATEHGRAPTNEQVAALEEVARANARYDFAKGMVIEHDGQSETFAGWLAGELPKLPRDPATVAHVEIPPAKSSAPDWTRGRTDSFARMVQNTAAHHDQKIAKECESWPNPYKAETWSRTNQAIMMNKNPALAMKYKLEAGV